MVLGLLDEDRDFLDVQICKCADVQILDFTSLSIGTIERTDRRELIADNLLQEIGGQIAQPIVS